jgi:hypothetical protein
VAWDFSLPINREKLSRACSPTLRIQHSPQGPMRFPRVGDETEALSADLLLQAVGVKKRAQRGKCEQEGR